MTQDSLYPKVQSALAQVTARKGQPSQFAGSQSQIDHLADDNRSLSQLSSATTTIRPLATSTEPSEYP